MNVTAHETVNVSDAPTLTALNACLARISPADAPVPELDNTASVITPAHDAPLNDASTVAVISPETPSTVPSKTLLHPH